MATLQELEDAIKGAHEAGDTAAAQRLADEIIRMKGVPNDAGGGVPALQSAPVSDVQAEYQAMSEPMKAFTAFNDILRLASNAITNNRRDQYAQYLGGRTPEEERAITAAAMERAGTAGIAGQMLPFLALPGMSTPMAVGTSTAMGMDRANVEGGGVREMLEGGAQGAASGILGDIAGRAIGGIMGAGSRLFRGKEPRMTAKQLAREKELLNFEIENSGVRYRPGTISDMLKAVGKATEKTVPGVHKKTIAVKKHLDKEFSGKGGSLYDVDQIQHMINRDVTRSKDAGDAEYGRRMNEAIDKTMGDMELKGILTSPNINPAYGHDLVQKARDYSKRSRKMDELEFKEEVAERRAQAKPNLSPTQAKQDQLSSILDNPSRRAGFTEDEIKKMDQVARGSLKVKTLKKIGELTVPGGGTPYPLVISGAAGTGAAYATGGNALAGVLGGALPIGIGMGAKHLANRATDKSYNELLDLIASGGKNAPDLSQFPKAIRQKIAQALAMGGLLAD